MRARRTTYAIVGVLAALAALTALRVSTSQPMDPDLAPPRLTEFFRSARPVDPARLRQAMRVAVVSEVVAGDKETNLVRLAAVTATIMARHPDTKLVVFGEAALGLYFNAADPAGYQVRLAEAVPGPSTATIGEVARRHHVHLAVGLIERADGRLYNALVVIDPDGSVIATHRKMLLHYLDERSGIALAAPNAQVVEVGGLRFGLAICADANSRWLQDQHRKRPIDALVYSVTSNVPFIVRWLGYWPMAPRYGAWILAANRFGQEGEDSYDGTAFIAGPNGAIHALQRGGGFVTAVIGRSESAPGR